MCRNSFFFFEKWTKLWNSYNLNYLVKFQYKCWSNWKGLTTNALNLELCDIGLVIKSEKTFFFSFAKFFPPKESQESCANKIDWNLFPLNFEMKKKTFITFNFCSCYCQICCDNWKNVFSEIRMYQSVTQSNQQTIWCDSANCFMICGFFILQLCIHSEP